MSDPYRSVSRAERAEAPRDPGIVGDIIAQFADPLAFYRELVQNAIDAGSSVIDIRLEYDDGAGILRVAVRDRGEGMTRDILENQLLVLFRSTKENDTTKIGKFGIGFASVLSPNPEVVAVHTARDGRRLALHLHRDLTYQLYDAGPATQTGTTVELDLAMRADEVAPFAQRSVAALERWCRHASVPINFVAQLPHGDPLVARIDRPLGLDDALVSVEGRSPDGKLYAVVGLAPAAPYTGFFNHGLMLHETNYPLLGHVATKLQDERLGHTLSRDDVRRDEHFEHALELARSLVERELPAAAATALRTAAESDHARWWALVAAIEAAKLELPRKSWVFPLMAPIGERKAITARDVPKRAYAAFRASDLSRLVAQSGRVVLPCPSDNQRQLAKLLDDVAGCTLGHVEVDLTAVMPVEIDDAETGMLALLRDHLEALHRAPAKIVPAKLEGALAGTLAIAGDPSAGHGPYVIELDHATENPFSRKRPPLVLDRAAELYRGALALDPRAGASLLARVMLLSHGLLDTSRSALLLERTLAQIGLET